MRVIIIILLMSPNSLAQTFLELCRTSTAPETRTTIHAIEEAIMDTPKEGGFTCEELMAHLQTLTTLDLRQKGITDLRPLSGLHNLEFLYLSENQISDLWALQNLPKLVLLDLKLNNIVDIGALPDFPSLEVVLLDNNNIRNILPIKDLFKLKRISLDNNPILSDDPHKAEEIKGLIESLIFFRSRCTIEHYAPLDLNDIFEAAILLNDMADRGDLSYFRALANSSDKVYVFQNQELWSLLNLSTKKIIIALSHYQTLTDFLIKEFQREISSILSIQNENKSQGYYEKKLIYSQAINEIENERRRVERAIQYFMMDPEGTYPFSLDDNKSLQHFFSHYAGRMKKIKKEHIVPVLKVHFSPRFVGRALKEWQSTAQAYPLLSTGICRLSHSQD